MKSMTKKFIKITLIIILLFIIAIGLDIFASYKLLSVTDYTIQSSKIKNKTKVVMIADLHDSTFGSKNQRLVTKIKRQEPDIILMVGDMLNDTSKDSHVPVELIQKLKKIAPIYYSWGNHEEDYRKKATSNLKKELEDAGAVVLERKYEDIKVNGNIIRVGGMYDYAFEADGYGNMDKSAMKKQDLDFLESFQATSDFKIMMAHRPESFIYCQAADTWNVDIVAAGHLHGGQVIIPGKGGLYGAEQGWFPKYTEGNYHFKKVKNMIVTRGLGTSSQKLPRFNNIPEVVSITLENTSK
ncbi:MAG: metallophosphoesterase [Anaerostipes sp.]|jgi:predicted MPP superfamily phosphohydrolase|nr:metallophosphoesterase [Anaerostipes sp.]